MNKQGKLFFLLIFIPLFSSAQDKADSLLIIDDANDFDSLNASAQVILMDTTQDKPNIAALYSAVLPGLGQIYNKKYWKLPLVYGGFVFFGYLLNYNHE